MQLYQGLDAADGSTGVAGAHGSVDRADCVVGIVSVAPATEVSGQGRVLAQLLDVPGTAKGIIFSEACADSSIADGSGIRLSPPGRNFAGSVRKRAAEIAVGATHAGCKILIGCSGSPYDLAATALAARYLKIPFVAYLFDDPIFQWPTRRLRSIKSHIRNTRSTTCRRERARKPTGS